MIVKAWMAMSSFFRQIGHLFRPVIDLPAARPSDSADFAENNYSS
jgi:hypothetical protein